nr:GTPase [uncultured Allomuricauda sp.]
METFDLEIIFIYNAKSDILSTVSDFAHKILSPSTYPCSLCQLTYGNVGMHKRWAAFLETLPYQKRFLHKDEAIEIGVDYPSQPLPIILAKNNKGKIHILLNAKELNQLTSLDDLIEKLIWELNKYAEHTHD